MDKINKLLLPVTIIIASLILGGFFYVSQVNKQKSIERQQEVKLQNDRRTEEAKAEQEKKEYVAKRRNECYSIYEKERDRWGNVSSVDYSELRDVCIIHYRSNQPARSEEECEKILNQIRDETDSWMRDIITRLSTDCLNNHFSKEF